MLLPIWLGKIITLISRIFNLGAGSTWPGHLASKLEPRIFPLLLSQVKKGAILIAGTNGKTTTGKMIGEILTKVKIQNSKFKIIRNESGANLLNGMTSALINGADWLGRIIADWAIFEVDEATLPQVIFNFQFSCLAGRQAIFNNSNKKLVIVLLNLFRDQLDRYGEIDLIADKWRDSLKNLPSNAIVICNADDPQIACIGKELKTRVLYFGLNDKNFFLKIKEHAVDSIYCPMCDKKLEFQGIYYSHIGIWNCPGCGQKRPKPDLSDLSNWSNLKYPLAGVYNRYNTLAAVLAAKTLGIKEEKINCALANFQPAFGRQEEFVIDGKKIRILLSKNPAGFNESIRVVKSFPGAKKAILLALNDRIPDGRDVSWIWDVDFEMISEEWEIIASGDRVYDMGLRIKYSLESQKSKVKSQNNNLKFKIIENLTEAIGDGLEKVKSGETLYILPTYSAMLEARKILGGRKIL